MKRKYLFILCCFCIAILLTSCSSKKDELVLPDGSKFLGVWSTDDSSLDINKQDNDYLVNVILKNDTWKYTCFYAEEKLVCNGSKYSNNALVKDDSFAEFLLEDSSIIWNDLDEDKGKGLKYIK